MPSVQNPRSVGRYLVFDEISRGGMGRLHLGRIVGDSGFSRVVAMKTVLEGSSASSFQASALRDEARLASRIRHPNVVQPLDVISDDEGLVVVMDYVHGVALDRLLYFVGNREGLEPGVIVAILHDVLAGLHAAHDAVDERGNALGIVHRDVTPGNIIVGLEGVSRLADFGIARASSRETLTAAGCVKGKAGYMSPEQRRGLPLSRRADVYAVGVVLAAALVGAPPPSENTAGWLAEICARVADPQLARIIETATHPDACARYGTAAEMLSALVAATPRASAEVVSRMVSKLGGDELEVRDELIRRIETWAAPAPEVGEVDGDDGDDGATRPVIVCPPPRRPALDAAGALAIVRRRARLADSGHDIVVEADAAPAPARSAVRRPRLLERLVKVGSIAIALVVLFLAGRESMAHADGAKGVQARDVNGRAH